MTDAVAEGPIEQAAVVPLSRREFLYYLWGISMAVALAGGGGAFIWFVLPRFREGEFGGVFTFPLSEIPGQDSAPFEFGEGRFWLVNIGTATMEDPRQPLDYPLQPGLRAIYKVCTHLGCLYKWNPTNERFQCPCHGSKFLKTGTRIDGPARRNLDVFIIEAVDENGEVLARTEPVMGNSEGSPLEIPADSVAIRIDTGRRVTGAANSLPGGGL
jgi:cytochrome b6-f complex iron-sulfur subunit